MKPIKLKMSAFGAYVNPIELDFEKGLGGEKFFLIHGATGSGKTTILDAICYALYGESSGGGRKNSMMRSEQASPADKTEVEFTFALRGKTYKIVRNPKYERAKLRGGGVTEEKASAEIFENGRRIEAKDVSDYVESLLGLDKEQFRQVVILPQGSFQKFLLAKSEDKQRVLNTLFNAEFFKRVEDELKLKASDAKNSFDELTKHKNYCLKKADAKEESLLTLIKDLSDELDTVEIRLEQLDSARATAQKNYAEGEKISEQFEELRRITGELADAQESLENILGELNAAQIEYDRRKSEEPTREELKIIVANLEKKKQPLKDLRSRQTDLKTASAAAEGAVAKVKRLVKSKADCDKTMAQLKSEVERLKDAPAKLEVAKQKLTDAKNQANLTKEIENLRGEVVSATKNLSDAKKSYAEIEKSLEELREAQKSGRAAILAATLTEGEPCPVCGAMHHPKLATSESEIPTDAQIKSLESGLKTSADKKSSAEKRLAKLEGELKSKEKILLESAETITTSDAQAEVDKLLKDIEGLNTNNARIKNGEKIIRKTDEELSKARDEDKNFSIRVENLREVIDNMKQDIDAKYLLDEKLLDEEISSTKKKLNALEMAFKHAQEEFNRLDKESAAKRATVTAAEKNKAHIAAQVEGKISPDMATLEKVRNETDGAYTSAVVNKTKLSERLDKLKTLEKELSALEDDLKTADENFLMWKTLSDAANGYTSKISFQRYYLATMFKEVIVEANNRLEKMSNGRYRFKFKEDTSGRERKAGLDLEIVDEYTGTARPVETLSGGESFLASLSLALGLAAVVRNNSGGIKLDTIFIDEGFGTLDSETLDFAMKTLIELQRGGRLVGIISHVEELKNQMPVRLEVTKTKTGSKAEFKYGLPRD